MAKKPPVMEAQVTALLVAQDIFKDERGRTHVIGIFDSIGAANFPVEFSFMVFCAVRGVGTHTVLIRIDDSLGDKIAESDPFIVEVSPQKGHHLFLGFGVTLRAPGLYKVLAFLDGVKEIEQPLFVRQGLTQPGLIQRVTEENVETALDLRPSMVYDWTPTILSADGGKDFLPGYTVLVEAATTEASVRQRAEDLPSFGIWAACAETDEELLEKLGGNWRDFGVWD